MQFLSRFPLLTCIVLISNAIYANSNIAVGEYSNTNTDAFKPLILNQDNAAKTWQFNADIQNMPAAYSAALTSGNCNEANCIAIGGYQVQDKNAVLPFILQSHDAGNTWNAITNIRYLPENYSAPDLHDLNLAGCFDGTCFITSTAYDKNTGYLMPSLLRGSARDGSWEYIDFRKLNSLNIQGVSCHDQVCIAAGLAINNKTGLGVGVARSEDMGKTWTYDDILKNPNEMAADNTSLTYNQHRFLIATMVSSPRNTLPAILTSDDAGKSWKENINVTGLPRKKINNAIMPSQINCHDNTCLITGGFIRDKLENVLPAIIVSHDNGSTWQLNQSFKQLPTALIATYIANVTYTQQKWILSGSYTTQDKRTEPFILLSNDDGNTWNNVTPTFMQSADESLVNRIDCEQDHCIAVGSQENNGVSKPFILESADGGWNWISNVIVMPTKTVSGKLNTLISKQAS